MHVILQKSHQEGIHAALAVIAFMATLKCYYTYLILGSARTLYKGRAFDKIPAKITVYTPYM